MTINSEDEYVTIYGSNTQTGYMKLSLKWASIADYASIRKRVHLLECLHLAYVDEEHELITVQSSHEFRKALQLSHTFYVVGHSHHILKVLRRFSMLTLPLSMTLFAIVLAIALQPLFTTPTPPNVVGGVDGHTISTQIKPKQHVCVGITDTLTHGKHALSHSQHDAALSYFERLQTVAPSCPTGWFSSGKVKFEQENFHEALHLFEIAISLDQTNSKFHMWRGETLNRLQQFIGALEALGAAISFDQRNPWAQYAMAGSLFNLNATTEAISKLELAERLLGTYEALKRLRRQCDLDRQCGEILARMKLLGRVKERLERFRELGSPRE